MILRLSRKHDATCIATALEETIKNIESEVLVGHSITARTEAGMQRKWAVAQRHHSRNAAGRQQGWHRNKQEHRISAKV